MALAFYEDHCWHSGMAAAVPLISGNVPVKCCHCGTSALARLEPQPVPGHGPYVNMPQPVMPKKQICQYNK